MPKLWTAVCRSYVGTSSLNAEHTYIDLRVPNAVPGHPEETIRIEHVMKEYDAARMNRKNKGGWMGDFRYRVGDTTNGFWTEADAILAGIEVFRSLSVEDDALVAGQIWDLDPQMPLAGSDGFMAAAQKIYGGVIELEKADTGRRSYWDEVDPEMRELRAQWQAMLGEFGLTREEPADGIHHGGAGANREHRYPEVGYVRKLNAQAYEVLTEEQVDEIRFERYAKE